MFNGVVLYLFSWGVLELIEDCYVVQFDKVEVYVCNETGYYTCVLMN